jgi:hypothetical protein
MQFRKLLLVVIALGIVTFSVGLRGQGLTDGIKVTLPQPVTIGDKVLDPGEYEIRRPSSTERQLLRIYNNDKMVYETVAQTVATGPDDKDPKETKVVLHHIGDAYYFDKIWMEDKNYGWEFPLPERVRALQREAGLSVPARYESLAASAPAASTPDPGPGLAAQLDALAAQQENNQQAALDIGAQNKADLDRQAELDRQAQADRERQDRDRVAALQPEPAPAAISAQSTPRAAEPQSRVESNAQVPDQLPETATNWLALLVGGVLLVSLSFLVRPARAQE